MSRKSRAAPPSPFRCFNSSPEVIRLVVMMYVKYPLSLRNVEDLLAERGIDICHETVRFWWNRFGPMFAAEIRRKRVDRMRAYTNWRWHLDEVFVKINGEKQYLWRAVDHEGEVLEVFATKTRNKAAALKFLKKMMKRHGKPKVIVTDKLRSYGAAMKEIGNAGVQDTGRWLNNRAENSHQPFRRRERAMLRFRRMHTLQKFSAVHASVHNHFNHVNGGRIPGQCGGVKAGHSWRGAVVCKKAPDRGPFCKAASASGGQAWVISPVFGSTAVAWFCAAPAWVVAARRRPADSLRR